MSRQAKKALNRRLDVQPAKLSKFTLSQYYASAGAADAGVYNVVRSSRWMVSR
ncbi:MAG: hypothetical protein QOJ64_1165 [Acidobacteriota bacterium]|jgi:hypothetical protein|nr:hypothetical protein [Acidobacteriota bacterium]